MACGACGSSKTKSTTYTHTAPDGTKSGYRTEVEAKAAVARKGGTYKAD
jgi:hypothetical protein